MNTSRLHILTVAFNLFLQKSYKEVTMKEMVEKTGMSKGAFYHYFSSKEQLFIEVVENFYIATPTSPTLTIDFSSLYNFYHSYFEHTVNVFKRLRETMGHEGDESQLNFFSLGLDAMRRFPGFSEKIHHVNREVLKIWIMVVKKARESGEIEAIMTDEQIAKCFIYLSEGIGSRFNIEGRASESDIELLNLWDSFYLQIKA